MDAMQDGRITARFDPHTDPSTAGERWRGWMRNFQYYLDGQTDLTDAQKIARLLYQAGPDVQEIYEIVQDTAEVGSSEYEKVVKRLNKYFVPKANIAYERQAFRNLTMDSSETVEQFALKLRKQIRYCNFDGNIEMRIRDEIIEKCAHVELKRKYLKKGGDLTLAETLEIARLYELDQKDMNRLVKQESQSEVNQIGKISTSKETKCFRCGYTGHYAKDIACPALKENCDQCGARGHFKSQCKTKKNPRYKRNEGKYKRMKEKKRQVRYVVERRYSSDSDSQSEDSDSDQSDSDHAVNSVYNVTAAMDNKCDLILDNKLTYKQQSKPMATTPAPTNQEERIPSLPRPLPKPPDSFSRIEETTPVDKPITIEKPAFIPPRPLSHPPKISPSSIPNPSPSVTANKQSEPSTYPNYNNYLYSIPGYSAFQPVSYPNATQTQPNPVPKNTTGDNATFPNISKDIRVGDKDKCEVESEKMLSVPNIQTDFEENFAPEIVTATSAIDKSRTVESKMSITSLSQGSGAIVTIPNVIQIDNKDKRKPAERFSLKTSIPISKIDVKYVNTQSDIVLPSPTKKMAFSPVLHCQKSEGSKVEIQSNVVIKTAANDNVTDINKPVISVPIGTLSSSHNINSLINTPDKLTKTDTFWKLEQKPEAVQEVKDPPIISPSTYPIQQKPIFNPMNLDSNSRSISTKVPEGATNTEQKSQILFMPNKSPPNPKMLNTIQQSNPQVLLQRANIESKNLQAPSRLSSQTKKCKDELVNEQSKVVALKRTHQDNCDENDFENLITENQIYGNKIVVKEKSQGTLQEQDLKTKNKENDNKPQPETKNVVLQPNFVYLSNVQFPANLMMIKNNNKVSHVTVDPNKPKVNIDSKVNEISNTTNENVTLKSMSQNVAVSKDVHVLKSSNILSSLPIKSTKTDFLFQTTNQKVIMNPQIVYQVPMILDTDKKFNNPLMNRDFTKVNGQKTDLHKPDKGNEKLFIACPYQMDSKLQPKIVITSVRTKIAKIEEISSLDIYEKRKRIRRLKYLTTQNLKENLKLDIKNIKYESLKNIITPETMKTEILKELTKTRITTDEGSSCSDSDYEEDDLKEYNTIIEEFGRTTRKESEKIKFMEQLSLANQLCYKEKLLERQERILQRDSVASAYISAGRLDRLCRNEKTLPEKHCKIENDYENTKTTTVDVEVENGIALQKKQAFLAHLHLVNTNKKNKEEYEIAWQEILKERKRRNGTIETESIVKRPTINKKCLSFDPNSQLRILTEIKKSVNENNNLIKMRLDSSSDCIRGESIPTLAEKNFSELNRLSNMADRSVRMLSGQDTRKRDLSPGFDSENTRKPVTKSIKSIPSIKIPNISNIISLKTSLEPIVVMSSKATSMVEPQNCAAGATISMVADNRSKDGASKEFGGQVDLTPPWPGLEEFVRRYKEFETARKKEILELQRRTTVLRVDSAHITRAAASEAERARALLSERQHLAREEAEVRKVVQKILTSVSVVRSYE